MNSLSLRSDFVKTLFCQNILGLSIWKFVETFYVPLKQKNPQSPILVRECSGVLPKLYARYGFGVEKSATLTDLSKEQVFEKMRQLCSSS